MNNLNTLSKNKEIGNIIIHDKLQVSLDGEHIIKGYVYNDLENRNNIRVGTYLQVPLPSEGENDEILCRIEKISYEQKETGYNEYETSENQSIPANSEELEKRRLMILDLKPISIVEVENNTPKRSRNIDTTPKPQTKIYECDDKEFLRTGLNIPKSGITVGKLAVNGSEVPPTGEPLKYNLRNPGSSSSEESAIWRHAIIAGSTGKGKTHTSKNIIRQFANDTKYNIEDEKIEKLPSIIIIDPENEYSQMAENPESKEGKEFLDQFKHDNSLEIGGIGQDPTDIFDFETFCPDVDYAKNPNNIDYKSFSIPFSIVKSNIQLAINYEPEIPTKNKIKDIIRNYFNSTNSPSYSDFKDKLNQWSKEREKDNPDDNKIPEELQDSNDRTWDAAKERLDSTTFENVFDTGSKSLLSQANNIFEPGKVSVIPTGHLQSTQQDLVVMSILSLIINSKIGNAQSNTNIEKVGRTPIILGLDEAHNYLSNTQNSIRKRYIVKRFQEAAKRGRKYKLGLLMITQNPEDIDSEIRKQSNTKIYLGMEKETLEKLNLSKKEENRIKDFGKGQMMVKAPDLEPVEVKGYKVCFTKHN
jgi:DNA helicase HerA-like ATPase